MQVILQSFHTESLQQIYNIMEVEVYLKPAFFSVLLPAKTELNNPLIFAA